MNKDLRKILNYSKKSYVYKTLTSNLFREYVNYPNYQDIVLDWAFRMEEMKARFLSNKFLNDNILFNYTKAIFDYVNEGNQLKYAFSKEITMDLLELHPPSIIDWKNIPFDSALFIYPNDTLRSPDNVGFSWVLIRFINKSKNFSKEREQYKNFFSQNLGMDNSANCIFYQIEPPVNDKIYWGTSLDYKYIYSNTSEIIYEKDELFSQSFEDSTKDATNVNVEKQFLKLLDNLVYNSISYLLSEQYEIESSKSLANPKEVSKGFSKQKLKSYKWVGLDYQKIYLYPDRKSPREHLRKEHKRWVKSLQKYVPVKSSIVNSKKNGD